MKEIGGYFELELAMSKEYHQQAIRLNTGRNALEYILRAKSYTKIYLPYYFCDVMLEPLVKLGIEHEFYPLNKTFSPVFDFSRIRSREVFLYINYFGLCDKNASEIAGKCPNVIVDNAQAFFSLPLPAVDTYYSPRKFFGIPDGAYLYTDKKLKSALEQDVSYQRFEYLLGRIDLGAEIFYSSFREINQALVGQPIKQMSKLTHRLLENIKYDEVAQKRLENFRYVHEALKELNTLKLDFETATPPLVYPFFHENGAYLKKKLIAEKVFVASYWPNVLQFAPSGSFEHKLASSVLFLPVDQRYGRNDLQKVIKIIQDEHIDQRVKG